MQITRPTPAPQSVQQVWAQAAIFHAVFDASGNQYNKVPGWDNDAGWSVHHSSVMEKLREECMNLIVPFILLVNILTARWGEVAKDMWMAGMQ